MRDEIWVGIDVGKAAHHACAVDAAGKVVFTKKLTNGQAEVQALIARAGKNATRVHSAVDMASGSAGLLLALLLAADASITYVPGRLVNRMAGASSSARPAGTIAASRLQRSRICVIQSPLPLPVEPTATAYSAASMLAVNARSC